MVINIKLSSRFPIDMSDDPVLPRAWAGFDPDVSDEVLWNHNRGRYQFSGRAASERYASLSYGGTIRVVAELTGTAQRCPRPDMPGTYWALVGTVLPAGHPVRDALVGQPDQTRRGIRYLPDPDIDEGAGDPLNRPTFLLTVNPAQQAIEDELYDYWLEETERGGTPEERWSTGGRAAGIEFGDRAYLLRQGAEPRGIIAAGTFLTGVFTEQHWRDEGRDANYADVAWEAVVEQDAPLPLSTLKEHLPSQHWTPQGSGTQINNDIRDDLARLWTEHVADRDADAVRRREARAQGRQLDSKLRKELEDIAQDRLMDHYRRLGYTVEDTRVGNPFDARATRDDPNDQVVYLEAKGTTGTGEKVIVTRGEVNWAREHPHACVIGIVSDIRVADGAAVADSGTLRIYDWDPDRGTLSALDFEWSPGPT